MMMIISKGPAITIEVVLCPLLNRAPLGGNMIKITKNRSKRDSFQNKLTLIIFSMNQETRGEGTELIGLRAREADTAKTSPIANTKPKRQPPIQVVKVNMTNSKGLHRKMSEASTPSAAPAY